MNDEFSMALESKYNLINYILCENVKYPQLPRTSHNLFTEDVKKAKDELNVNKAKKSVAVCMESKVDNVLNQLEYRKLSNEFKRRRVSTSATAAIQR